MCNYDAIERKYLNVEPQELNELSVSGFGISMFINGQKIAKDEDRIPTQSPVNRNLTTFRTTTLAPMEEWPTTLPLCCE